MDVLRLHNIYVDSTFLNFGFFSWFQLCRNIPMFFFCVEWFGSFILLYPAWSASTFHFHSSFHFFHTRQTECKRRTSIRHWVRTEPCKNVCRSVHEWLQWRLWEIMSKKLKKLWSCLWSEMLHFCQTGVIYWKADYLD